MKKYAIYGIGVNGKRAYEQYKGEVGCFIDKIGNEIKEYDGIPIKTIEQFKADNEPYRIIISSLKYKNEIIKDLENLGIFEYVLFHDTGKLFGEENLIFNPYEYGNGMGFETEKEWNYHKTQDSDIERINNLVEEYHNKDVLFDHVEIETINRCNGVCEFCPVSVNNESRHFHEMDDSLFKKIICELAEIDYKGKLALFSNNEPFLDKKIIDRHKYARKMLPKARMHLFTNGTLATLDDILELLKYLDELVIDNYNQELKLIKVSKQIVEYEKTHPEIAQKVTICLRKPREILTSRGGDAPNRKDLVSYPKAKCILPYKQFIIRPDGKVSLCCNDPLGRNTLGNVQKERIIDIWNNDRFKMIRECLYSGREKWSHCKYCDTFYIQ